MFLDALSKVKVCNYSLSSSLSAAESMSSSTSSNEGPRSILCSEIEILNIKKESLRSTGYHKINYIHRY